MKRLIIMLSIIFSLFALTGCGKENTENKNNQNSSNEEVFVTVNAKGFYDNINNDFYKQYINKKITINGLTADGPDFINYNTLFVIICDNEDELPSSLNGAVSVTGVVSDSDFQSSNNLRLKKCVVK